MCTVTYLPTNQGAILTSSRDEHCDRKPASVPHAHVVNGTTLYYPKDGHAGGSWIVASEHGQVGVILNGAFAPHLRKPPYSRSRGLILLDIMSHVDPVFAAEFISLENVEPFTLILYASSALMEMRWDGQQKHWLKKDTQSRHIWSSATLYDANQMMARETWFAQAAPADLPSALQFHLEGGKENPQHAICMNRNDIMMTVSISSLVVSPTQLHMHYLPINKRQVAAHHQIKTAHQTKKIDYAQ